MPRQTLVFNLSDEAIMRNDLERIDRVQAFKAQIRYFPKDDEAMLGLTFSDEVVVNEEWLFNLNIFIEGVVDQHGKTAVMYLNQKVTNMMQDALLDCGILFGDEAEADTDASDDAVQADFNEEGEFEVYVTGVGWT